MDFKNKVLPYTILVLIIVAMVALQGYIIYSTQKDIIKEHIQFCDDKYGVDQWKDVPVDKGFLKFRDDAKMCVRLENAAFNKDK